MNGKYANTEIDKIVQAAQKGPRYQHVDQGLVRSLAAAELQKGRAFKAAVKAVRSKLHQVGSAYHSGKLDYPNWEATLQNLPHARTDPALLAFCRQAMEQHASTSERLPFLESFFHETLAPIGRVKSVLDLACGLNPLATPWMLLEEGAQYYACDIYSDMVAFLNSYLSHIGIAGKAKVCNLVESTPQITAQVAFLLKTIPCLEHLDRNIGARLLENIPAEHILVSFPARSLGGRSKGMLENYEKHFEALISGTNWQVKRFEFPTELAYLITRQ